MSSSNSAVILLSGGLDSLVSLGLVRNEYEKILALTFDYGQKVFKQEAAAAEKISEYYNIKCEIIKLDWLKNITNTALVSDNEVPENITDYTLSMKSVWVPNRNGLFLNIAACYADSYGYRDIIIGANKEEAVTFSDNTEEFIHRICSEFEYSTLVKPNVRVPLIKYDKLQTVKVALEHKMPLDMVWSCYNSGEKHCGRCESCMRLKNALSGCGDTDFINRIF